jgi:hypothetical protein
VSDGNSDIKRLDQLLATEVRRLEESIAHVRNEITAERRQFLRRDWYEQDTSARDKRIQALELASSNHRRVHLHRGDHLRTASTGVSLLGKIKGEYT